MDSQNISLSQIINDRQGKHCPRCIGGKLFRDYDEDDEAIIKCVNCGYTEHHKLVKEVKTWAEQKQLLEITQ